MKISKVESLAMLVVLGCLAYSEAAVDVLYDFEDQTSRLNIVDVLAGDGSQNGQVNQTSGWGVGDGPSFGPTDGRDGTGGIDFTDIQRPFGYSNLVETQNVIDFATSMSFSVDINPPVVAVDDGYFTSLFWTGRQRGTGETGFNVMGSNGPKLHFYMAGLNPGAAHWGASANPIQLNQYQSVGFTLGVDPGHDVNVEGRTLRFYINGGVTDTFSGLGIGQATLPGNGHAPNSPVQVGWAQNLGYQVQLQGLADNIFVSDRHLTGAEMAALQIPEPATLVLLGIGAVGFLRRRK